MSTLNALRSGVALLTVGGTGCALPVRHEEAGNALGTHVRRAFMTIFAKEGTALDTDSCSGFEDKLAVAYLAAGSVFAGRAAYGAAYTLVIDQSESYAAGTTAPIGRTSHAI